MSNLPSSGDVQSSTGGVQYLCASAPTEQLHEAMERDGTVVLKDLLDEPIIERINREMDPVLAGPALGLRDAAIVTEARRVNSSMRHSPTIAQEVAAHPVLMDLAGSFLLEHCDTLQIGATQVTEIHPGEPAQLLHRDDYNWGHVKGRTHPLSITTIIALTDFTPTFGATRVIPGSHRWDDALEASTSRETWKGGIYAEKSYPAGVHEELAVPLSFPAGSAVSVLGTTVHGGGSNTSANARRRGLVIQYCVGWIRTTHSNHLMYPPDFARTLPEPVQRLLGYQLEAKHCGQLEQGVDPITLLRD